MNRSIVLATILVLAFVSSIFVIADPVPFHDLTEQGDYRRSLGSAQSNNAYAGNTTELSANFTSITKTWQGYFGNITGKIVLDDANNMSMYDWDVTNPTGNIFAANETISDWSSIQCFNFTANGTVDINLSKYEQILDCAGDADGVNETFSTTTHATIYVGSQTFTNECPATKTYVNDGASTSFDEVLLYEPNNDIVVYAAVIYNDNTGFDNTPTDFQMLVGENGHGSAASTTTQYYFYVELY